MTERKNYIDNIRWITLLVIIVYHLIYVFNCSGVISNIGVKGIPVLDSFLIFVYPWFMCLLFIISGISSKYSLQKRTGREFLKDRFNRILIPSIAGMFAYGWVSGLITNQYVNMFGEAKLPGAIKYLIFCLSGTGPLWFCHVLFIACAVILIIRKIDNKNRLEGLGKKVNFPILLALVLLVWGSSFILNTPFITIYRFGIYIFMYLLGYYVFSNDEIIEKVATVRIPLGIVALITGVAYTFNYYGTNYTENSCLQSIFTNFYLWISILAILGFGKVALNFKNKFTEYMTKNNFSLYVLHYIVLLSIAYLTVTYLKLPFALNYIVILVGTVVILPLLVELVKRIPVLNRLVLGVYKR